EEVGGQVALAGIREDHAHDRPPPEATRHADGRRARGPRGDAHEQPLVAGQRAGLHRGLFIGYRDHLVVDRGVEDLRTESRTDPLETVEPRLAAGEDRRTAGPDA